MNFQCPRFMHQKCLGPKACFTRARVGDIVPVLQVPTGHTSMRLTASQAPRYSMGAQKPLVITDNQWCCSGQIPQWPSASRDLCCTLCSSRQVGRRVQGRSGDKSSQRTACPAGLFDLTMSRNRLAEPKQVVQEQVGPCSSDPHQT